MRRSFEQANHSHPYPFEETGQIRVLSFSMAHRASTFFLSKYVSGGMHSFLPHLLQQDQDVDILRVIVSATGLAALASTENSSPWNVEAYRWYGNGLRELQVALQNPVRMASDGILGAVMILGTFEVGTTCFIFSQS